MNAHTGIQITEWLRALRVSGLSAFDQARLTAEQFGVEDFDAALLDHLRNGVVVTLPHLFMMAKGVEYPATTKGIPRRAWLITHAIGDIRLIAETMPFPLPWIAFKRRLDQRVRFYRTERVVQLARSIQHSTP